MDLRFVATPDLLDGGPTEVSYRVAVVTGPAIDVYVLTDADYERYLDGLPAQNWTSAAYEKVRSVDDTRYLLGPYHLVIDNTDFGAARPGGLEAVIQYSLSPPPAASGTSSISIPGMGIAVSSLGLAIGFVLAAANWPVWGSRRRRSPSNGGERPGR